MFFFAVVDMSSECNKDIPEPSLPIAKKGRKGTMKRRRPKYVLRLPSQKAPILESPIDQQNPSATANVVPIPSQPSIAESTPSQPSIDQPIPSQPPIVQPVQPYVNEPTPSSMASQCVGARLTSLSSPLNKMIHQPQYPLDLFIMYFRKTNTCLPKKQVNHP